MAEQESAEVTKLRIFRWGDDPGLPGWIWGAIPCILAERCSMHSEGKETHHRSGDGSAVAPGWGTQQPPEAGQGGTKSSPKPQRAWGPCRHRHLDFGQWNRLQTCSDPPEWREKTPQVLVSYQVYGHFLQQQREANIKPLTISSVAPGQIVPLHSGLAGPTAVPMHSLSTAHSPHPLYRGPWLNPLAPLV